MDGGDYNTPFALGMKKETACSKIWVMWCVEDVNAHLQRS